MLRTCKSFSMLVALALVLSLGIVILPMVGMVEANPGTMYVPDDYTTIQEAVNNASSGDTIIVRDGNYTENIDVSKDHLTIRSENGAASTIVQAANSADHVFNVTADWVNITGFTVKGATGYGRNGIYLNATSHCNISSNNVTNNYYGIYLFSSSNNTLTNNIASNNSRGIYLDYSSSNTLTNNTVLNNTLGIWLCSSSSNNLINDRMSGNRWNFGVYGDSLSQFIHDIDTSNKVDGKPIYYWVNRQDEQVPQDAGFVGIVNCTNITAKDLILTNNMEGVLFAYTDSSRIENVTVSNNFYYGMYLYYLGNTTLTNNTANSNSFYGMYLYSSSDNTLTNNTADSHHSGIYLDSSSNNVLSNNTAERGYRGIRLCSSSNNTLTDNTASSNNDCGIYLDHSSSNLITNNTASNDPYGIYLYDSSGNTINNNTASNNEYGILLMGSSNNNSITSNIASNNGRGIYLRSPGNTITNNNVSNNEDGIFVHDSSNNTIANNNVSNNEDGISLVVSSNCVLTNNTMVDGGIRFQGWSLEQWNTHTIDISNKVNGKPVYYWKDRTGGVVPAGAGQVILANCTQVTVENQNISNAPTAISLGFCDDSSITNNTASNNREGIFMQDSSNNTLANNTASNNSEFGIRVQDSSNNTFVNNTAWNNTGTGPYIFYSGAAIFLDSSSNNTLTNNSASNNRKGICMHGSSNNTLANNTASNNTNYGISLYYSSSNTLENNIADLNTKCGIYLKDSDDNQIRGNDILNNSASSPSGIHLDYNSAGNVIHFNNIVGNSPYGVYNENTLEVVDAENNWWGAIDGPDDDAGVINGPGDKISTNVDAAPWLEQSYVTPAEQTTTATGSGTASFSTNGGAIISLEAVDEGTLPTEGKPGLEFPHGFFSFNITDLSNGQAVNVTITLPQVVPVGTQYWKYHASEGGWIQIPMGSDDGDEVITITLVDGGLGDDDGAANGIIVDQGGPGVSLPVITAPTADFSATLTRGAAPLRVQFSDESTGEITSWLWDFGDGATAIEQNPTHTYMYAGRYTVILMVTGPGGADTASTTITIVSAAEVLPPASFSPSYLHISPQQVYANDPVQISVNIANNGGQSDSYQAVLIIDGPDGRTTKSQMVGVSPGSCQNVVFTVSKATPGTYYVSLAGLGGQFTVMGSGIFGGGLGTGGIIAIVVVAIIFIGALTFIVRGTRREI